MYAVYDIGESPAPPEHSACAPRIGGTLGVIRLMTVECMHFIPHSMTDYAGIHQMFRERSDVLSKAGEAW